MSIYEEQHIKTGKTRNCTCENIKMMSSGGSDTHPLPVCEKCGWIVVKDYYKTEK